MIIRHPYKVPKTAMEVFEMLPEGTLCQVIDNTIYMSPSPTVEHQHTVSVIQNGIFNYITQKKLGICVQAPLDIFLDDKNVFQPGIVFISNDNLTIIKEGKVRGAPDIVIEVLSPGSEGRDLGKKKAGYERNGVKEYFVVKQKTSEVQAFYLKSGKYEQQPDIKGKIISKLLKKTFRF